MSGGQLKPAERRIWPVVEIFQGQVCIGMPTLPMWLALDPETARQLAEKLLVKADQAQGFKEDQVPKA